jgi:hypothetical protein
MSNGNLVFLSGVAMQPSAIREAYPGARFVARASVVADPNEVNAAFAEALPREDGVVSVWGIAIRAQAHVDGNHRHGHTDEQHDLELMIAERPLLAGDPEAVLAAALYWELPPAYTAILREAAGVAVPEAEGGWESPVLEAEPPASVS